MYTSCTVTHFTTIYFTKLFLWWTRNTGQCTKLYCTVFRLSIPVLSTLCERAEAEPTFLSWKDGKWDLIEIAAEIQNRFRIGSSIWLRFPPVRPRLTQRCHSGLIVSESLLVTQKTLKTLVTLVIRDSILPLCHSSNLPSGVSTTKDLNSPHSTYSWNVWDLFGKILRIAICDVFKCGLWMPLHCWWP